MKPLPTQGYIDLYFTTATIKGWRHFSAVVGFRGAFSRAARAIVGVPANNKRWNEPLIITEVVGKCYCYLIVGGDVNNGHSGSINVAMSTNNGRKSKN